MNKTIAQKIKPYTYIAPVLIFVIFVFAYPIYDVLIRSFKGLQELGSSKVAFVGLKNYRLMFADKLFWVSLKNSFTLLISIPIMAILAIFIAEFLFDKIKFSGLYQGIIFFPYVLAIPVVGVVFSYILQLKGILNQILNSVGLSSLAMDWLGNSQIAIWSILFVLVWKQTGLGVVIFVSRMGSIDKSIYEAAKIDGANWWQRLFRITIPLMASVIEFFVVISILNTLSWIFDYIYVITGGGPAQATYVLDFYIYQKAFSSSQMFIACSAAVSLLLIATVIIFVEGNLRKKMEAI